MYKHELRIDRFEQDVVRALWLLTKSFDKILAELLPLPFQTVIYILAHSVNNEPICLHAKGSSRFAFVLLW